MNTPATSDQFRAIWHASLNAPGQESNGGVTGKAELLRLRSQRIERSRVDRFAISACSAIAGGTLFVEGSAQLSHVLAKWMPPPIPLISPIVPTIHSAALLVSTLITKVFAPFDVVASALRIPVVALNFGIAPLIVFALYHLYANRYLGPKARLAWVAALCVSIYYSAAPLVAIAYLILSARLFSDSARVALLLSMILFGVSSNHSAVAAICGGIGLTAPAITTAAVLLLQVLSVILTLSGMALAARWSWKTSAERLSG